MRDFKNWKDWSEFWFDIPDYNGDYQVSSHGRIRSLKRKEPRILKCSTNNWGYRIVCLCKDGVMTFHSVHRLIADCYVYNPDPSYYTEVNHINEIKTDNRPDNLEWVTSKENSNHGTKLQRSANAQIGVPRARHKVLCVETDTIYNSTCDAARQTGFDANHISACCRGEQHTSNGFHWKYL